MVRLRINVRQCVIASWGPRTSVTLSMINNKLQSCLLDVWTCSRHEQVCLCVASLAWDDVMPIETEQQDPLHSLTPCGDGLQLTYIHTHTHALLHNAHHFRASNGVCMCVCMWPNGKSRNTSLYVCLCVCKGVSVFSNICNSAHESQSFWGQMEEDFNHGMS